MYVHACVCDSDTKQCGGLDSVFHEGRNQTCHLVLHKWVGDKDREFVYEYVRVRAQQTGWEVCTWHTKQG